MQKRFCSQTFTVCRTLLLWELIFVQVEGKKTKPAVSLNCVQAWCLCFMGIAYLRSFAMILLILYCSALICLECFRQLYVKTVYMHFMPDFCVYKQSENSLVHKQQLQSQHFFSLHMCKFATIYLSDAKSHLRLFSVPDLDTSYFLDEVQLTQS